MLIQSTTARFLASEATRPRAVDDETLQTVIGNPAHDLIRLGLSLAMAACGSALPGIITARMLEYMVNGYESAFAPEARGETVDRGSDMPETVRLAMRRAAGRSWKHLADERIEGSEPLIPLGKRFWPLTSEEHATVEGLFAEEPVRKRATSLRSRAEDAEVRVLAAYLNHCRRYTIVDNP